MKDTFKFPYYPAQTLANMWGFLCLRREVSSLDEPQRPHDGDRHPETLAWAPGFCPQKRSLMLRCKCQTFWDLVCWFRTDGRHDTEWSKLTNANRPQLEVFQWDRCIIFLNLYFTALSSIFPS